MDYSTYQLEIFNQIRYNTQNLMVVAAPGSGKTTTILHATKKTRTPSLVLAFNRAIAQEIESKLPIQAEAQTTHSRFLKDLRAAIPGRIRINKWKVSDILTSLHAPSNDKRELESLVSHAKACALEPSDDQELYALIEAHDLYFETLTDAEAAGLASEALSISNESVTTIDFDDMLYLPVILDLPLKPAPLVFIDEAQDLAVVQRALLMRMAERVIAVGDPHQAIYAFRGADSNSMTNFQEEFNAHSLPLSISYRNPRAIIDAANTIYPNTIEPAPEADSGAIFTAEESSWDSLSIPPYSLVLSRTNSPLVHLALILLANSIPFSFPSRFIDNIARLHKKHPTASDLNSWFTSQQKKFHSKPKRLQPQEDKYNALTLVLSTRSPTTTLSRLAGTHSNSELAPIRLSTIHKAKGLEYPHVFIIRPDLLPAPWAQGDDTEQEDNLHYVAITRSSSDLTYVYKKRKKNETKTPKTQLAPNNRSAR